MRGARHVGAPIDHAAGILIAARPGDRVGAGDTVLELLYTDPAKLERARHLAESALRIDDAPPAVKPLVLDSVR